MTCVPESFPDFQPPGLQRLFIERPQADRQEPLRCFRKVDSSSLNPAIYLPRAAAGDCYRLIRCYHRNSLGALGTPVERTVNRPLYHREFVALHRYLHSLPHDCPSFPALPTANRIAPDTCWRYNSLRLNSGVRGLGCKWSPPFQGPMITIVQLEQEVFKWQFKDLSNNCQTVWEQGL